jgi:hypothetical protein
VAAAAGVASRSTLLAPSTYWKVRAYDASRSSLSATAAAAPSRITAMDFSDSAALAAISTSAFAVAASRSF